MTETLRIFDDVPQGSPEWKALRLGIPTASCFSRVMAVGDGKVRDLYLRMLAGEVVTEEPREEYRNGAMDRGNAVEPSLRATFAIETGFELRQIGFGRREMSFGPIGASPDSLIGDDCGVEFKSAAPHVLIEIMRAGRVPPEHLPQVQGNMLVFDRPSWWIAIGYPGMPLFRRLVRRDSAYCERLKVGLAAFHEDLADMVAWVRKYGRD